MKKQSSPLESLNLCKTHATAYGEETIGAALYLWRVRPSAQGDLLFPNCLIGVRNARIRAAAKVLAHYIGALRSRSGSILKLNC